jgi:hypothetical protein
MPGGYSEAASRVLTMLEETWQAIRARPPEIPPVVIIARGTTGWDARWGHFYRQRWTIHTTGTLTKILLIQTSHSHIFEGGTANVDLAHGRRRSVASPPLFRVSPSDRVTKSATITADDDARQRTSTDSASQIRRAAALIAE